MSRRSRAFGKGDGTKMVYDGSEDSFHISGERPASPIPDRWRDGCQRSEAEPASGVTAGRD